MWLALIGQGNKDGAKSENSGEPNTQGFADHKVIPMVSKVTEPKSKSPSSGPLAVRAGDEKSATDDRIRLLVLTAVSSAVKQDVDDEFSPAQLMEVIRKTANTFGAGDYQDTRHLLDIKPSSVTEIPSDDGKTKLIQVRYGETSANIVVVFSEDRLKGKIGLVTAQIGEQQVLGKVMRRIRSALEPKGNSRPEPETLGNRTTTNAWQEGYDWYEAERSKPGGTISSQRRNGSLNASSVTNTSQLSALFKGYRDRAVQQFVDGAFAAYEHNKD